MAGLLDALLSRLAARIAPLVAERLGRTFSAIVRDHLDHVVLPQLREQLVAEAQQRSEAAIAVRLAEAVASSEARLRDELTGKPLVGSELYLPGTFSAASRPGEYMAVSVPLACDFLHPKYIEFAQMWGLTPDLHRKYWEWAFIHQRLDAYGMLVPGKRGLGFGVGREQLPALFARAGVLVTATDSPSDEMNWGEAAQYGGNLDALFAPHLLSREDFEARVSFEPCDMRQLPGHLTGYDFCWSSCCFEHLGDLQRGLDFVVESVERCLVVGGIACHTTEFNLSSDDATIEAGRDVIYRKRDLDRLCRELEARGHWVEPLKIEPGDLPPDWLVDLPPYRVNPHLKLRIGDFVATSIGLVIRRGK